MTVAYIPVSQNPNQSFQTNIEGKMVEIHLYIRARNLFMDLSVDGETCFNGKICRNRSKIDRFKEKLNGYFMFIDTDGDLDPYYTGLNERWFLLYVQ